MFARLPDVAPPRRSRSPSTACRSSRAKATRSRRRCSPRACARVARRRSRRAARAVLHDGRVLRLPGHDRRAREPAGVPRPRRARHARDHAARRALARMSDRHRHRHERRRRGGRRGTGGSRRGDRSCAERGLSVALFDEQSSPGGQIYRGITASVLARRDILGDDYRRGAALVAPFMQSGAPLRAATPRVVDRALAASASSSHCLSAAARVAARPRARGDPRDRRARAAVSRPRLDAAGRHDGGRRADAAQDVGARAGRAHRARGQRSAAVARRVAVAARGARARGAPRYHAARAPCAGAAPRARRSWRRRISRRAASWCASVRRRVRVVEYVDALELEGDEALTAVRFRRGGDVQTLAADHVLLHQGVVPDINLASAAGCAIAWDDVAACFVARRRTHGAARRCPGSTWRATPRASRAPKPRKHADASPRSPSRTRTAASTADDARPRRAARAAHARGALRGRRFLDVLYRPADAFRIPHGDTIACRCEEVPAATIARLAREGCAGPNQMKAYTRCGMGPCQGRYCGLTVTEIIARETQRAPAEVGSAARPLPGQAGHARRTRFAARLRRGAARGRAPRARVTRRRLLRRKRLWRTGRRARVVHRSAIYTMLDFVYPAA